MFRRRQTIAHDIATFAIEGVKLCTQKKDSYIFEIEGLDIGTSMYNGFYLNHQWYLNGLDNGVYLLEKGKEIRKIISDRPIAALDREHGILLLTFNRNGSKYKRSLFDIYLCQEITTNPQWFEMWRIIVKRHLVYYSSSKKDISAVDLVANEILWHFSLSDIGRWYSDFDGKWNDGEIWHFVEIVDNLLWVSVVSGTLIAIDTRTGELKHVLKDVVEMNDFPDNSPKQIPIYSKTTYDANGHKLWGIEGYSYWEVDLKKYPLRLNMWYLVDELKRHRTTLPNYDTCGVTNEYILFSMGGLGGDRVPQVSALNRKTLKIDWQCILTSENGYYSPVKADVVDSRLFVLDNEGSLHCFEKTS